VAPQVGEVDLGLQPGRCLEAHDGLLAAYAVGAGEVFEYRDLPLVAELADLVQKCLTRQLGELGQTRDEIVLVRLELGWRPALRRPFGWAVTAQRGAHGVA